ncbi:hypothetical protein AVEN_113496-1 [Araneus ventricosus]|uniref:Uncharacterized protein n=1 Tax=Araneus ventricosus TaxID=182803 RepID=A0A4Y2GFW8_ARAVE|nr:hypothetical protein AVEN_113496-1 [Araneus ventricosus]
MNETNLSMDNCMENNQVCLHSVMEKLGALLRSINPFAESYLQMHQLIQSNPAVNVKMVFMEHPDLGRYITPTSRTEVSAIFVGDDGELPANRDICIYPVTDSYKKHFTTQSVKRSYGLSSSISEWTMRLEFQHGTC